MKNDRIDSVSATPAATRFRLQNLAISGVTICLFLLAISNDFYGKLQAWVNGESWVRAGERMRDIGIELVIRPKTASAYSLDNILTFGFFASLGLSAFAFQQSRRLRRALEHQQRAEQESRRLAMHAGGHQVAFFESELEHVVKERNWIESELHKALKDNSIVPFFQPIVDLATRDVIGYEALARWRHAERGLISPAEFIPVAESCGLMAQLGEQMLRKASLAALTWPAHIKLSVNLSPVQLREKTLGLKIIGILGETGLSPHRLEVEITENALVADLLTARDTIDQLRAAGITIALDDFGTGHSTLQHLRSCKFDKLKIDRSFVASMKDSEESRLIVDAILGLSRSFGISCTAEGIEDQAELDALSISGCTEGQGYLFGRPTEEAQLDGVRGRQAAA